MKVIRFALAILLIAFLAQAVGLRLLFILDYALIGLLIVSLIWARLSLLGLSISRQGVSERVQAGTNFEEVITLKNQGPLPKIWLEITDNSDLQNHQVNCVQSLGPFGRVKWRASTLCELRGRYRLGPVTVATGDPFGLFRLQRVFKQVNYLVVYPATFDINKFEALSGALPGGSITSRSTQHTTPNINGLREYRPGDGLNRIHWPSSMRFNKLVVKEFEFDPIVNVQIFLDMDESKHWVINHRSEDTAGELLPASSNVRSIDSTEEYLVTAAATLSRFYLEAGRSVGLVGWGQHREFLSPDRGERQLIKVLEALAMLRARGTTEFGQLIAAEINPVNSADMLILITSSVEDSWVSVLPMMIRKKVKMAVVLVEPRTFGAPVDSSMLVAGALASMNIPLYLIKRGDNLTEALDSELARLTAHLR